MCFLKLASYANAYKKFVRFLLDKSCRVGFIFFATQGFRLDSKVWRCDFNRIKRAKNNAPPFCHTEPLKKPKYLCVFAFFRI